MDPRQILHDGRKILDKLLLDQGFIFSETAAGKSSGGDYASGKYEKGNRCLEIHFRTGLGLVCYHIGDLSLSHEHYMRSVANGGNKYPGFSDDPIDAFRDLAYDIERFCRDFLSGSGEEFARCVSTANDFKNRSGFSRMVDFES